MLFRDIPIRKKLLRIIFLINGIVLLVTCVTFFIYEFYIFRKATIEKLSTIGKIIAVNSTAALAFDNPEDAKETLAALKTERHIMIACLYDKDGKIFAQYPDTAGIGEFPDKPGPEGFLFASSHLEGFEPVTHDRKLLGTLYLKSDLGTMYERLRLYAIIVALVITISFVLAYLLSRILQKSISAPILALAKTAKVISDQKDYSVRAVKTGKDELGSLTDAFNQMLGQIEEQNHHLSEFNQNLEQKVTDRTEQLETVNKELEAFSYSISHDLRAPLRGIVGFTAMLEENYGNKLDDEARRITSVIKSNTLRMGNLIDDLLAFSRMSRQEIVKTNISTDALVKEIIREFDTAGNNNIAWHIESMPETYGDINTIRQVWINLISNARKYSRNSEKPSIEIGSFRDKKSVVFFVKDNGVGFDPKYMDKLFKVFQRLHSVNEFEGTGVGLAIVEKIISKHGGRVWAEAEKGSGAIFYFSLPQQ
ncbi:MAG TPA: ATP-binding protein [Ferruginibacter sp.]|nr:ATP-binding protein [Ferruginibacter sp.]